MRLFNYDSPFMAGLCRITDYMSLGLLWVIASVPVITFGASTTAMLLTAEISVHQGGKVWMPFWKYFRSEFKQATILWLMELPVLAIVIFNLDYLLFAEVQIPLVLRVLIAIACVVIFCWVQLWFGYQSKFKDTVKTVLANTFRMTLGNMGRTFWMGVLTVATLAVTYLAFIMMPPVLILIPGFYIMIYTALLRKLVKRYIPCKDPVTEEITE